MTVYPNLDKLNALLRVERLGLPEFRSRVDSSGRNLKWLKKIVLASPHASLELKRLLSISQTELLYAKDE